MANALLSVVVVSLFVGFACVGTAAAEQEIHLIGTATRFEPAYAPGGCSLWWVTVEQAISGPSPCANPIPVICSCSGTLGYDGYCGPDISEGERVEVYGVQKWDVEWCYIDLPQAHHYIKEISGAGENQPPVADFMWDPAIPRVGETVQFIDLSHDPDGTIVEWHWYRPPTPGKASSSQNPSWSYDTPGTYEVLLIVRDNDNATSGKQKYITVKEQEAPSELGCIDGYVRDSISGSALSGARVEVVHGPTVSEATTNSQGYFKLCNLAPGNYQVSAIKNGYILTAFAHVAVTGRAPCDHCEQAFIQLEPIQTEQPPDLVLADIDWVPANPTDEDKITINVRVANQGAGDAASFRVALLSNETYLGDKPIAGLAAGSTATIAFTGDASIWPWMKQCDMEHTLTAYIYYNRPVDEPNIANNELAEPIYISCASKPSGPFIALEFSASCSSGDQIQCTLSYDNQLGEKAQVLFVLRKELSGEIADHKVVEVDQGTGTANVYFDCPPNEPGAYRVSWKAYKNCEITFDMSFNCPRWSCSDILMNRNARGAVLSYDEDENGQIDSSERDTAYRDYLIHGLIEREQACAVIVFNIGGCTPTAWSTPAEEQEVLCPCGGTFIGLEFTANCIETGPYANYIDCRLSYHNNLNESAWIRFTFEKAGTGEVIVQARPYATAGSGGAGALFECPPGEPGTYRLSWEVYRASDTHEQNPVAWCEPGDELNIGCPCGSADEIVIIEGETDSMGEFTFTANGDIVRVTVVNESSNPVSGNHIRAIHTGKNVIVHTHDPDGSYFPSFGFKSLSASSSNSSEFTVDPKIAPVILVGIAVVGMGLTAHELITDPPGHFEVLRDDDLKLKCKVGDINDVLAVASAICTGVNMFSTASGTIHATSSAVEALGWGGDALTVFGGVQLVASQVTDVFRALDEDHTFCWLETLDGKKVAGPYIDNWPPTARFEACGSLNGHRQCYLTPISEGIFTGMEVEFDADFTEDMNDSIDDMLFDWAFGDGATHENRPDPEVSHIYQKAGTYTVKLTVRDPHGGEDTETMRIRIETGEVTPEPVACFNASPTSGEAPLTVDFDSSCSSGEIDAYFWEFGDGNNSSQENPTHTYDQAGPYAAKLTVSGPGGEDSTSETITVQEEDHPPTLSNGQVWPETGYANDTEFTFSVVYRDEDGDEPEYHELRISAWQPYVDLYLTIPKESGSIESGATYSLTTTLQAAKDYGYYFWFESKGNLVEEPPYDEEPFYNLVVLGNQMIVTSTCPVDLAVTDPDGLVINKEECQIPSATYEEKDIDGDGELDDQIYIPTRKVGDYRILVIPELRARPSDKYTLEVSAGAQTAILADGVQIRDTPDEPYKFESTNMTRTVSLLPGQNLLSLGLTPEDSSPEAVIDEISGSLDLRHWNSAAGTWETVVNGRLTELDPLEGYYIWVSKDVSIVVEGMPISGDQTSTLGKAGWQQIGVPYMVAWGLGAGGSISVEHSGAVKCLSEAVAAGWISGTISQWDTEEQEWIECTGETGGTLDPWSGYWIYTFVDDVTLVFSDEPNLGERFSSSSNRRLMAALPSFKEEPEADADSQLSATSDSIAVINAPNPIRDARTTTFMVTGICPCLVSGLMVSVYGLDGHLVWEGRTAGSELAWHTETADGEWLANGIYIYVAQVNVDGQWIPVDPGKLAVLR